jgi:CcmD family protein
MDPILEEIYSTILPSAPFLIAAYALVWVALLVYVIVMQKGIKNSEKRLTLLEEAVAAKAPASNE